MAARDRFGKMGNLGDATIDTADVYSFGNAEDILGEALQGRRDEFVLVTKGFLRITPGLHDIGLSRAHITRACEASLRRLRTDYLDLYICHQPDCFVRRCGDAGQGPLRRLLESFRLAGDEGAGGVRETQPHATSASRSTIR